MDRHARLFARRSSCPALADEGIQHPALARARRRRARGRCTELFRDQVFPVLTPLAVDPAHPFPYISGLSLNLAVVVRNPDTGTEHFARVKVPPLLPRFVRGRPPQPVRPARGRHRRAPRPAVPGHGGPRSTTPSASPATRTSRSRRTTPRTCSRRSRASCMRRRFGPPVRLEVEETIDPHVLELLVASSASPRPRSFRAARPARPHRPLRRSAASTAPTCKYPRVRADDPSAADRGRDRHAAGHPRRACASATCSLHHPYDSFSTSVQAFLEQAAADPHVLAIKQTLYRTTGDSPIVDALIDAAEAGKQVLALVEIKARFDEQANIKWARKLEQAGCHVVYGLVGLKTHCKLSHGRARRAATGCAATPTSAPATTTRRPPGSTRTSACSPADPAVGEDVAHLFNVCPATRSSTDYQRLLVAPHSVRDGLRRADRARGRSTTAPAARRGSGSRCNSIVDEAHHRRALPGLAGRRAGRRLGPRHLRDPAGRARACRENIRVRSILGRFLEHSPHLTGSPTAASPRSGSAAPTSCTATSTAASRRSCRLKQPEHVTELDEMFDLAFDEGTGSWWLHADDTWQPRLTGPDGEPLRDLQERLIATRGRRRTADPIP